MYAPSPRRALSVFYPFSSSLARRLPVCQCVLELKPGGSEDPTQGWKGAKVMMSDSNFLQKLKTYPKDDITEKMINRVLKIVRRKVTDPKHKLTTENLQRVSRAAAGLFTWVCSIVQYVHDSEEQRAPA